MKPTFTPFDAADYLEDEETIAAYLNAAIESGDTELLLVALKDVANARSDSISKDSGLARASLYKALTPGAKPQFETVMKVAGALGLKLEFHPVSQH